MAEQHNEVDRFYDAVRYLFPKLKVPNDYFTNLLSNRQRVEKLSPDVLQEAETHLFELSERLTRPNFADYSNAKKILNKVSKKFELFLSTKGNYPIEDYARQAAQPTAPTAKPAVKAEANPAVRSVPQAEHQVQPAAPVRSAAPQPQVRVSQPAQSIADIVSEPAPASENEESLEDKKLDELYITLRQALDSGVINYEQYSNAKSYKPVLRRLLEKRRLKFQQIDELDSDVQSALQLYDEIKHKQKEYQDKQKEYQDLLTIIKNPQIIFDLRQIFGKPTSPTIQYQSQNSAAAPQTVQPLEQMVNQEPKKRKVNKKLIIALAALLGIGSCSTVVWNQYNKDNDKDGIKNWFDKCPDVAGVQEYAGCPPPDTDGDGVLDADDLCVTVAGLPEYGGCPAPEPTPAPTKVPTRVRTKTKTQAPTPEVTKEPIAVPTQPAVKKKPGFSDDVEIKGL